MSTYIHPVPPAPPVPGFWPATRTTWLDALHGGGEDAARRALHAMADCYRQPILRYLRFIDPRLTNHDAEDLCSRFLHDEFLARSRPESTLPGRYDPAVGRLRSYLCSALRKFIAKANRDSNRLKRGGGAVHVPLDEADFSVDPAAPASDDAFDRMWALKTLALALARVERRWKAKPHLAERFAALCPLLIGDADSPKLRNLAAELGISANAFQKTKQQFVHELRRHLREIIAPTVPTPADIDDELRHLCRVLAAWRHEQ